MVARDGDWASVVRSFSGDLPWPGSLRRAPLRTAEIAEACVRHDMTLPTIARLVCAASLLMACGKHTVQIAAHGAARSGESVPEATAKQRDLPPPARELARVDTVAVPGDLPVFALHGEHVHRMNILFLQGKCGRSVTYANAMTPAAAAHGDLLALQADVQCADGTRRWSSDVVLMSNRIDRALAAEGRAEASRDMVLVGFSQGAERIEWFAARYPERVRGVVLMSGPVVPSLEKLGHVRAAVFTAGAKEWQGNMRAGAKAFAAAGIPTKFIEVPDVAHGALGPDAVRIMNEAFDFIEANTKDDPNAPAGARCASIAGRAAPKTCRT